jgi:hypothetical protein
MTMRNMSRIGLLALVGLTAAQAPARAVDPAKINSAIDDGVNALRGMQRASGIWAHQHIGATALAGLTLLECGVASDDRPVLDAARAVREAGITCTHTYSIALSILFLDRLGDPGDVPLIESLGMRLLAGQNSDGGWTYDCPAISDEEERRLATQVKRTAELVARRELPRSGAARRTVNDLSPEVRAQLERIGRAAALDRRRGGGGGASDNSNTQFALLGLWVARRHGLPVEDALLRVDRRFRTTRIANSGWGYRAGERRATGTMTCAAVLGLAVAHGVAAEAGGKKNSGKDATMQAGLNVLGYIVRQPLGTARIYLSQHPGGQYYFLWSLERVCVTLSLPSLGKRDWYSWGAEYLLETQQADGTWHCDYGACADTCFALLFLKRSNLARDLTAEIKGQAEDPGEAVLRATGVVGAGPPDAEPVPDSPEPEPARAAPIKQPLRPERPTPPKPEPAPRPTPPAPAGEGAPGRLVADLPGASAAERASLLEQLRDGKGPEYTEALASVIVRLQGDAKTQARNSLARRLARMKEETVAEYLKDEDTELRRAAAQACGLKGLKGQVAALIGLLHDPQDVVAGAAHASLKALTKQSLGPDPGAWEAWWKTQGKD